MAGTRNDFVREAAAVVAPHDKEKVPALLGWRPDRYRSPMHWTKRTWQCVLDLMLVSTPFNHWDR
jgi:hypothetical protein